MPDSVTDAHRAQLEALVKPFRDQLAQVEVEIVTKESELSELKEWRTKLKRMLAPIDPTLPMPGRKKEQKTRGRDSNEWHVSEETRAKVEPWLRKTFRDQPFTAQMARKGKDPPGAPETLRRTMMLLVDAGALRLDRVDDRGAKYYVFTGDGK